MKSYPMKIVGILFKKIIMVSDALEGIMVYSAADLSFLKILNVPKLT